MKVRDAKVGDKVGGWYILGIWQDVKQPERWARQTDEQYAYTLEYWRRDRENRYSIWWGARPDPEYANQEITYGYELDDEAESWFTKP